MAYWTSENYKRIEFMEQEERQWQIGEIPWHCILQMEWISEQKTRAEKKPNWIGMRTTSTGNFKHLCPKGLEVLNAMLEKHANSTGEL